MAQIACGAPMGGMGCGWRCNIGAIGWTDLASASNCGVRGTECLYAFPRDTCRASNRCSTPVYTPAPSVMGLHISRKNSRTKTKR